MMFAKFAKDSQQLSQAQPVERQGQGTTFASFARKSKPDFRRTRFTLLWSLQKKLRKLRKLSIGIEPQGFPFAKVPAKALRKFAKVRVSSDDTSTPLLRENLITPPLSRTCSIFGHKCMLCKGNCSANVSQTTTQHNTSPPSTASPTTCWSVRAAGGALGGYEDE